MQAGTIDETKGVFIKVGHGVKHRAHLNLRENEIS
jgi:hypothetical protein